MQSSGNTRSDFLSAVGSCRTHRWALKSCAAGLRLTWGPKPAISLSIFQSQFSSISTAHSHLRIACPEVSPFPICSPQQPLASFWNKPDHVTPLCKSLRSVHYPSHCPSYSCPNNFQLLEKSQPFLWCPRVLPVYFTVPPSSFASFSVHSRPSNLTASER